MTGARALQPAVLLLAVLIAGRIEAATILFDFEDQVATSGPSEGDLPFLVMSSLGLEVRLSRTSGAPFDIFDTSVSSRFPTGWGDRTLDPFADVAHVDDRWLLVFSQPIRSFSIQFGDFGGDDDSPVNLLAFDDPAGLGNLIDKDTAAWPEGMGFPEFGTLNVSGAGIRSVLFWSEFVDAAIFPNSLLWDNLLLETETQPAPEPRFEWFFSLAIAALVARYGLRHGTRRTK
jgi:hypothetical protein